MKTMVGSSLPPIACRMEHVLFTLFMFVLNVREYKGQSKKDNPEKLAT
jgi:hypothetical protein